METQIEVYENIAMMHLRTSKKLMFLSETLNMYEEKGHIVLLLCFKNIDQLCQDIFI